MKKKNGFTLIEIMVVIVIMGILAAVGLFLIILLLLLAFGGGYLLYRGFIRRDDRRVNNAWSGELWRSDSIDEAEFEKMKEGEALLKGKMAEFVSITSRDGLKLWARYFEHPAPRGIFLMVHGYRSSSLQDFSAAVKPVWDMGYSLFMIDQRAMGR